MRLLAPLLLLVAATHSSDRPTPSVHIRGPHGLEGWTLSYDTPGQGRLPVTLIIARNGKVIRRIAGDDFVWEWIFQQDGKQVAYESGPLHFSLQCTLVDLDSGKQVADYDCFPDPLPRDAPAWVKALKSSHKTDFGN